MKRERGWIDTLKINRMYIKGLLVQNGGLNSPSIFSPAQNLDMTVKGLKSYKHHKDKESGRTGIDRREVSAKYWKTESERISGKWLGSSTFPLAQDWAVRSQHETSSSSRTLESFEPERHQLLVKAAVQTWSELKTTLKISSPNFLLQKGKLSGAWM